MIIRESPIDNAWYRVAGMWFIALMFINCLAWPTLDFYGYELSKLWPLALAMPLGSLIFFLVGKACPTPKRVLAFVSIIGAFGILPLIIALLLPIFALIFSPPGPGRKILFYFVPFLISSTYWAGKRIFELSEIVIKKRFIEREFKIGKDAIYLNRAPKTDIESPIVRAGSSAEKVGDWLVPKLAIMIPLAYPAQRFISGHGGIPAVMLLLSILGTPLALFALFRFICGFYLWIYTVFKIEQKYGKKVFLSEMQ